MAIFLCPFTQLWNITNLFHIEILFWILHLNSIKLNSIKLNVSANVRLFSGVNLIKHYLLCFIIYILNCFFFPRRNTSFREMDVFAFFLLVAFDVYDHKSSSYCIRFYLIFPDNHQLIICQPFLPWYIYCLCVEQIEANEWLESQWCFFFSEK